MATIIDSFIVTLGLDPKGFSEGQRQATESMRRMERQTDTSAKKIEDTSGRSLRLFLGGFGRQFDDINKNLDRLGTGSRRTGLNIEAGAKQGQYGLLALAAAGTAAYTAIKSVEGIYRSVTSTIADTAALGRTAEQVGVPLPWLSRLRTAAYQSTATPMEATDQDVRTLRSEIDNAQQHGIQSERLTRLLRLKVDYYNGSPDDVIQRIFAALPSHISGMPLHTAQAFTGLHPALTQFFHQGDARVNQAYDEASRVSATDAQTAAASKQDESLRKLTTAWTGLIRALQTAHPELEQITTKFYEWLVYTQNNKEALEKLGAVAEVVITGGIVIAIGGLVAAVRAGSAAMLATPLGRMLFIAWGVYEVARHTPSSLPTSGLGIGGPRLGGGTLLGGNPNDYDTRNIFQRGWDWLTGAPAPGAAAIPPGAGGGGGGRFGSGSAGGSGRRGSGGWGPYGAVAIDEMRKAGASEAFIQGAIANGLGEGGFASPWQKAWGGENSFGHWQLNAQGELPGYLSHEGATNPQDTRAQTRHLMRRAEELSPGITKSSDARAVTDTIATRFEKYQGAAPGQRYDLLQQAMGYTAGAVGGAGSANRAEYDAMVANWHEKGKPESFAQWSDRLGMVAAARAGQPNGASSVVNNHGDVPINQINIQTQATDALGIGKAIGSAIKHNIITFQSNTGLY